MIWELGHEPVPLIDSQAASRQTEAAYNRREAVARTLTRWCPTCERECTGPHPRASDPEADTFRSAYELLSSRLC
jgi:hypothetical protein